MVSITELSILIEIEVKKLRSRFQYDMGFRRLFIKNKGEVYKCNPEEVIKYINKPKKPKVRKHINTKLPVIKLTKSLFKK